MKLPSLKNWRAFWRREKTNLFLGGIPIIIALLLFVNYFLPQLSSLKQHQILLKQKQKLLLRYRQKLKEMKPPPKKAGEEVGQYLFSGRDPYVIVSQLQKDLASIPEISVRSFRIISQKPFQEGIKKVEISFDLEGDIKGLAEVLELLEGYKKALKINYLMVTNFTRRRQSFLRVNLRLEALFKEAPPTALKR